MVRTVRSVGRYWRRLVYSEEQSQHGSHPFGAGVSPARGSPDTSARNRGENFVGDAIDHDLPAMRLLGLIATVARAPCDCVAAYSDSGPGPVSLYVGKRLIAGVCDECRSSTTSSRPGVVKGLIRFEGVVVV